MPKRGLTFASLLVAAGLTVHASAAFAGETTYSLTIKDHQFTPAVLNVPAGEKVRLEIENADATPEEFESHALNVEKIIPGKSKRVVLVGPLEAGVYPFVGEFHEDEAKGKIVVK